MGGVFMTWLFLRTEHGIHGLPEEETPVSEHAMHLNAGVFFGGKRLVIY